MRISEINTKILTYEVGDRGLSAPVGGAPLGDDARPEMLSLCT